MCAFSDALGSAICKKVDATPAYVGRVHGPGPIDKRLITHRFGRRKTRGTVVSCELTSTIASTFARPTSASTFRGSMAKATFE